MVGPEPSPEPRPSARRTVPALVVPAVVVVVEALALLGVGVSVVLGGDRERLLLDVTTTAFFLASGTALLVCARALLRARRWARAPVVLAQLLQALVAWGFLSGQTRPVALLLAGAAVVVLVALLSPPATRALLPDEPAR